MYGLINSVLNSPADVLATASNNTSIVNVQSLVEANGHRVRLCCQISQVAVRHICRVQQTSTVYVQLQAVCVTGLSDLINANNINEHSSLPVYATLASPFTASVCITLKPWWMRCVRMIIHDLNGTSIWRTDTKRVILLFRHIFYKM